jgi:hypothetical protein
MEKHVFGPIFNIRLLPRFLYLRAQNLSSGAKFHVDFKFSVHSLVQYVNLTQIGIFWHPFKEFWLDAQTNFGSSASETQVCIIKVLDIEGSCKNKKNEMLLAYHPLIFQKLYIKIIFLGIFPVGFGQLCVLAFQKQSALLPKCKKLKVHAKTKKMRCCGHITPSYLKSCIAKSHFWAFSQWTLGNSVFWHSRSRVLYY